MTNNMKEPEITEETTADVETKKQEKEKEPRKLTRQEKRLQERLNKEASLYIEKKIQEYLDEVHELEKEFAGEITRAKKAETEEEALKELEEFIEIKETILDSYCKRFASYIRSPKFTRAGLEADPTAFRGYAEQEDSITQKIAEMSKRPPMPEGTPEGMESLIQDNLPEPKDLPEREEGKALVKIGDRVIQTSKTKILGEKVIKAAKLKEDEEVLWLYEGNYKEVLPTTEYLVNHDKDLSLEFVVAKK